MAVTGDITMMMIKQFSTNVQLLCQQLDSRFAKAVRVEPIHAEYAFFDQIGPDIAEDMTTRHGPTPIMDEQHQRRRVHATRSHIGRLIDAYDLNRILTDPTSAYVKSMVAALFRKIDDKIIAAAVGPAYTGKEGETAIQFDSAHMVVANTVGSGTTPTATGMNVEKLLAASEILNKYDVPENDRYVAMSAKQHAELLADQRTTSRDYIGTFTLENGRITNFVGFNIILSERLPKSGSDRECLFWQKDGLLLAVNEDVVTKISERDDLAYSKQIYIAMDNGATRMEECRVGKILCKE